MDTFFEEQFKGISMNIYYNILFKNNDSQNN